MNQLEDAPIRRTRRVVTAAVAMLAIVLAGTFVGWRWHLAELVNGRLAALRAAGLPTSGAELNQWYAIVPDSENAALVLTEAFALLRTFPDARSNEVTRFKPPPRGQPLTTNQIRLLSEYVRMNAAALAKAKEGLVLPKARYPVDLSPGFDVLLPHLSGLKALALIYRDQALLDCNAGDCSDATSSIDAILGLAHTLDEEPLLLSELVRMAIVKLAKSALEGRLNAKSLDAPEFAKLARGFAAVDETNLMWRALVGERAMAIPYFLMGTAEKNRRGKAGTQGSEPSEGPAFIDQVIRVSGYFQHNLRFYLEAMHTNIALANLGPPNDLAATNVDATIQSRIKGSHLTLSRVLLPNCAAAMMKEAESLACVRVSIAALNVERFRMEHGRLPSDLRQLVPEFLSTLPADPFDGTAIRYHLLPKGYVIYSVGRDGQDDGGTEPPTKRRGSKAGPEDITLIVER
jgi:hypothetical protein